MKSELREIKYTYQACSFVFTSDCGVFSKDKIDFGSRLLVETLLQEEKGYKNILDVGCGYGFMGIVLSKFFNLEATLIDVNKRAVHLTEMNLKKNQVKGVAFVSDLYQNVSGVFDLIITNPPIRAGKKVILTLLKEAKNYLNEQGVLWFVIRKNQGAKSIIKEMEKEYRVTIQKKEKGFYVIKAKIS